jgi:hypothetical protein
MAAEQDTSSNRKELARDRQREALRISSGAWKIGDHPELPDGGAAYVDSIRSEPDERFDDALKRQRR